MRKYTVYYSQNREDLIIEGFFPDIEKGCYIDVGANHPFYHSVTKRLYDKGWHGINIEPNPMLLKQLEEHRSKDTNLMLGIGDKPGMFKLRVYHSRDGLEGISTLSQNMKKNYTKYKNQDTENYTDIEIEVITLTQLFNEQKPKHLHVLKIDVEGLEYEVLKGNDWKRYRPELICIEANHMVKDWYPILQKANYSLVFNDGINNYYLSEESLYRKDYFDYVDTFLSNTPAVTLDTYTQLERIPKLEKELKIANKKVIDKTQKIEILKFEIEQSRQLIENITPLRKHVKRQIKQKIDKQIHMVSLNRLRK